MFAVTGQQISLCEADIKTLRQNRSVDELLPERKYFLALKITKIFKSTNRLDLGANVCKVLLGTYVPYVQ